MSFTRAKKLNILSCYLLSLLANCFQIIKITGYIFLLACYVQSVVSKFIRILYYFDFDVRKSS